jgi:uncharacterized protein YjiS (DUF1127 family)
MLDIPMSVFPASQAKPGFAAWFWRALDWPARVIEARQTRARLAELSEREWLDISAGREEASGGGTSNPFPDSAADRQARSVAIRAWHHGGHSRAA